MLTVGFGVGWLNMIEMQAATANSLGLVSSGEITVSKVRYRKKNSLGGREINYDVITGRVGSFFFCSGFVVPGLTPLGKAALGDGGGVSK